MSVQQRPSKSDDGKATVEKGVIGNSTICTWKNKMRKRKKENTVFILPGWF
jgi:hypothetical protein